MSLDLVIEADQRLMREEVILTFQQPRRAGCNPPFYPNQWRLISRPTLLNQLPPTDCAVWHFSSIPATAHIPCGLQAMQAGDPHGICASG
jgi:hypothetical protein